MKLRYYISGHGLGHASRSCQIIATLRQRPPRLEVEVLSPAQREELIEREAEDLRHSGVSLIASDGDRVVAERLAALIAQSP